MEIFDGYRALLRPLARPAIALGNFDGFHEGHQALIARAVHRAADDDGDVVVYTFDPHPAKILAPDLAPPLITSRERKLELLAEAGVTVAVVEPFTRELAAMSPDDFHAILRDVLTARHLVVGYDFTYGHKRSGSVTTLTEFARSAGIGIDVIEAVDVDGVVASSTKVRELVAEANLPGARRLLGRPFDVDGTVVPGAGRGRTIGIPTANVETTAELLPPSGVYAVWLQVLGAAGARPLPGAANLGVNPTFGGGAPQTLEVHVIDFDGDLYGQAVRVAFVQRLRAEKRFDGPEQLVAQIRTDIDQARDVLSAP